MKQLPSVQGKRKVRGRICIQVSRPKITCPLDHTPLPLRLRLSAPLNLSPDLSLRRAGSPERALLLSRWPQPRRALRRAARARPRPAGPPRGGSCAASQRLAGRAVSQRAAALRGRGAKFPGGRPRPGAQPIGPAPL